MLLVLGHLFAFVEVLSDHHLLFFALLLDSFPQSLELDFFEDFEVAWRRVTFSQLSDSLPGRLSMVSDDGVLGGHIESLRG